jgi:hypothetical protein
MSNRFKAKPIKKKVFKTKREYEEEATYTKKFRSFNIFSGCGENRVVKAPYPMTLNEAMVHFKALAISGND